MKLLYLIQLYNSSRLPVEECFVLLEKDLNQNSNVFNYHRNSIPGLSKKIIKYQNNYLINGYTAHFNRHELNQLNNLQEVVWIRCTKGIGKYLHDGDDRWMEKNFGEGVNVYVIDSKISISHKEFEDVNIKLLTVNDEFEIIQDSVGGETDTHGTAVASLIVGKNLGLAKKSNTIGLNFRPNEYISDDDVFNYIAHEERDRVINKIVKDKMTQSNLKSKIIPNDKLDLKIEALNKISRKNNKILKEKIKTEEYDKFLETDIEILRSRRQHLFIKKLHALYNFACNDSIGKKAIINLSPGLTDPILLNKLDDCPNALVVKSAGNQGKNAMLTSITSNDAIIVGTTQDNEMSNFSNFGNSVFIYVEGQEIEYANHNFGYEKSTGTSISAPIVASFLAKVLSQSKFPLTNLKAKKILSTLFNTQIQFDNLSDNFMNHKKPQKSEIILIFDKEHIKNLKFLD